MERISEAVKVDIGLAPQSLVSTNATGSYYSMANYRKVLAHLVTGTIVAAGTVTVALFQATSAAGAGSKAITNATATLTANTNDVSADIALASMGSADTFTINGVTFTKGASTVASTRTFVDYAGAAADINDATYGVSGVTAVVANTSHIVLTQTSPRYPAITVTHTNSGGTITSSTDLAQAYVEVEASQLDQNNGFYYVAAKVTTAGATVLCAVSLLRGEARNLPDAVCRRLRSCLKVEGGGF